MTGELPTPESEPPSPLPPAGWYPDPKDGSRQQYWDGADWTGQTWPPTTAQASAKPWPRNLIIGGAAGLALSPFLPWIKVVFLGNLSLFDIYSLDGGSDFWPWAPIIGAAAVLAWIFGKREPQEVRSVALVVGLLGGALAAYVLIKLRQDISDTNGLAAVGFGPYVCVAACIALVVGALNTRVPTSPRRPKP